MTEIPKIVWFNLTYSTGLPMLTFFLFERKMVKFKAILQYLLGSCRTVLFSEQTLFGFNFRLYFKFSYT